MASKKAVLEELFYAGLPYRRQTKDTSADCRGTVFLEGTGGEVRRIGGFPHVPRREGVVLKSGDSSSPLKQVTPASEFERIYRRSTRRFRRIARGRPHVD